MDGYTYSGVFVRAEHGTLLGHLDRATVHRLARSAGGRLGCSRWPRRPTGPVAGRDASLLTLARTLASDLSTIVIVARVERDRVLRLDGWDGTGDDGEEAPRELGGYLSDPTVDAEDDDVAFPEPEGAHHAEAYAHACERPEAAEALFEVLAEDDRPAERLRVRAPGHRAAAARPATLADLRAVPAQGRAGRTAAHGAGAAGRRPVRSQRAGDRCRHRGAAAPPPAAVGPAEGGRQDRTRSLIVSGSPRSAARVCPPRAAATSVIT